MSAGGRHATCRCQQKWGEECWSPLKFLACLVLKAWEWRMKILWDVIFKDAEEGKCFTFRSDKLKRTQRVLRIKHVSEMTKTFLRDLLGQFS